MGVNGQCQCQRYVCVYVCFFVPIFIHVFVIQVQENSAVNSIVTSITFSDEDYHQSHTMRLKNSANGQFKLSSDGQKLLLAKLLDYETQVSYTITLEVTDNGTTPLSVS